MTTWINVNKQVVARNAKLGTDARLKDVRPRPNSLSLPTRLSTELFASAKPVRLAADEVLFHALDTGDGCYRIEEGLLKVTMASRPGTERILTFLGPGAIVGEL